MKNVGYYNGKIAPMEEITVPMNDRAVYFGDGVYDAAYIRNGVPFAIGDHISRFYNSCSLIGIDFKLSRSELEALLRRLCTMLDGGEGMLYWQTSRGTATRSHVAPEPPLVPNLLAFLTPKPTPNMKRKIKAITVEDERYLMCHIKTLNLIPNVLASTKAERAGCDEAVFHRGEIVTECSHSNINMLKDGVFVTPPLDNMILPGTVRRHILSLCAELGIKVDERKFTLGELFDADEAVVSSATGLIRSISEIDGKPVGGKAPKLLENLQDAYWDRIVRECGK